MPPSDRPRRILVVGSGGREHALLWRLSRDPDRAALYVVPGNDAMAALARRLPGAVTDVTAIVDACAREAIGLVVIGPEAPLAAGLADALRVAGIAAFGPSRAAAALECSKAYAKDVMRAAGVATARAETFTRSADVRAALARATPPWVIKADGLAAGKGVCVTSDAATADRFVRDCLEHGRFGAAGARVLVEQFLSGEELTAMAITDGGRFVLLPPARDHKRAHDGDQGPNTGGMGAFAPALRDPALERRIGETVVAPVLAELARRGTPFQGVLYAGLVIDAAGPRVLEFNARFGDPETETVLPLVTGDLTAALAGAARGALDTAAIGRAPGAAVSVAVVDGAYPDGAPGNGRIEGLDAIASDTVQVFHAGTARAADGAWTIRGGRAAYVTAIGGDVAAARTRAYAAIDTLGGAGWRVRRDIAASAASAGAAR